MRPEARRKPRYAGASASTIAPQTKSECDYIVRKAPCETRSAANEDVACDIKLSDLLDRITGLSGDGLRMEWSVRMGGPASQLPENLLRLLLAYHIQEQQLGGLDETVAKVLDLAAQAHGPNGDKAASGSISVLKSRTSVNGKSGGAASRTSSASPSIGTRLIREWNGQTIRVDVRAEGFVWSGSVYASLSAIARAVTGARWSGPRFFALEGSGRRG